MPAILVLVKQWVPCMMLMRMNMLDLTSIFVWTGVLWAWYLVFCTIFSLALCV